MMIKSILISKNTRNQQIVTEVEYEKYDIKEMNRLLGASCFTSAGYLPNGDGALVDDEGLFSLTPNTLVTKMKYYAQPVVGNILITGVDSQGGSTNVLSTLEQVQEQIEWSLTLIEAKTSGKI